MAVGRVTTLVVEVTDLSASARFYREGLGLDLHVGADNDAPGDRWISGQHAAISWTDGAFFHFSLYQSKSDITRAVQIGFSSEDIAAAHAHLVNFGAHVIHPPRPEPWGATARYSDPDGNIVSVTQPNA